MTKRKLDLRVGSDKDSILATVNATENSTEPKRRSRRRKTAHLKNVPETKLQREQIKQRCFDIADKLDKTRPLSKDEMEKITRSILAELDLPESFVGWTMVMLASAFWRDQVAAVPPSRRLFLLPHCLKHAAGCPADYDEYGLDCKTCGACSIADFRGLAEDMGYKVLVAEGSPIVLKIIVSGYVDAIVGVACLNVLEKAIDKILLAGVPCMAVPLLSSDCRNTSVDEDWVDEMIRVPHVENVNSTQSYLHLMRGASKLFQPAELDRLAPRMRRPAVEAKTNGADLNEVNSKLTTVDGQPLSAKRSGKIVTDPISGTEEIAYDFLGKGGKYSRPFITLAVYDALTGGKATQSNGDEVVRELPDGVKRAAMSIETFHKASLVHDDVEDNDPYRYGEDALHCRYGIPTAINVGDYLVGMGYRLVTRDAKTLGGDTVAEILDTLADAHQRLAEGQGAELLWRDNENKQLKPIDALKIYALKTAPAFEAALMVGARLAGEVEAYREPMKKFARNIGIAFQMLNDLKDFRGDTTNKVLEGGDILGGRPTILWALALENLKGPQREELLALVNPENGEEANSTRQETESLSPAARLNRVRHLYHEAGVIDQVERLIDKHQQRAEEVADELEPDELRRLLYYLVDTVLDRGQEVVPTIEIGAPIALNGLQMPSATS